MRFLDYIDDVKFEAHAEGHAEGRAEGLAEGLAEGRAEGRSKAQLQFVANLMREKMTTERIAALIGESVEVTEAMIRSIANN